MDGDKEDNNSEDVTASVSAGDSDSASVIGLGGIVSSHKERKEQIVEQVPDSGDIDSDLKDDIRYFFLWSHAVIEYYSAHLIRLYLIDDNFDKATWDYFIGGSGRSMSQSHREEILTQGGIFDGIEGRIGNVRCLRNRFAHEPFSPIQWEEDNIETKMGALIDIIDKLYSALDDEEVKKEIRSGKGLG